MPATLTTAKAIVQLSCCTACSTQQKTAVEQLVPPLLTIRQLLLCGGFLSNYTTGECSYSSEGASQLDESALGLDVCLDGWGHKRLRLSHFCDFLAIHNCACSVTACACCSWIGFRRQRLGGRSVQGRGLCKPGEAGVRAVRACDPEDTAAS